MAMSSSIVSIVTMLATTSLRSTHILILEFRSHKSSGLDKNNTTVVSPSVVLKGDEKAEKRKEEFGGKFNCHRGGKRTTWCKIKGWQGQPTECRMLYPSLDVQKATQDKTGFIGVPSYIYIIIAGGI
ncbi:uncharacterized protein [Henckelia pumila]|uniref:uncharacterized protein isoform X8 n=1 Tax=Henckelia pumila TaxID=405737 RepID=UPI003C6E983B